MNCIARLASALILPLLSLCSWAGEVKVLIRYDDYSKFSNTDIERRLLSGIAALEGGVLVGVIPFPYAPYPAVGAIHPPTIDLDVRKITLLNQYAEAGSVEIAVHGYSHVNNASNGALSELAVLPEADQVRLLTIAKSATERSFGREISTFVPSFNNHNAATLRALEKTGFTMLSAGALDQGQASGKLRYLPGAIYGHQLPAVARQVLASSPSDALIVVVLHNYDFAGSGERFPSFRANSTPMKVEEFIDMLRSLKASAGVRFVSLGELVRSGEDLSPERLKANSSLWGSFVTLHRLLPEKWGLYPVKGVYYAREAANSMHSRQVIVGIGLYALVFGMAAFTVARLLRLSRRFGVTAVNVVMMLSLLGLAWLAWRFSLDGFYISAALATAFCSGTLASSVFYRFKNRTAIGHAAHGMTTPAVSALQASRPEVVARPRR